jgi:predicted DNA-binding transcriptional regulator AlpA
MRDLQEEDGAARRLVRFVPHRTPATASRRQSERRESGHDVRRDARSRRALRAQVRATESGVSEHLGIAEVVAETGLSRRTVYENAKLGKIPGAMRFDVGGWRFPRAGVEQFKANAVPAPVPATSRPRPDARAFIDRVKEMEVVRSMKFRAAS